MPFILTLTERFNSINKISGDAHKSTTNLTKKNVSSLASWSLHLMEEWHKEVTLADVLSQGRRTGMRGGHDGGQSQGEVGPVVRSKCARFHAALPSYTSKWQLNLRAEVCKYDTFTSSRDLVIFSWKQTCSLWFAELHYEIAIKIFQ